MNDLSRLLQALADETRVEMLCLLLRHDELCVCDLMNALDITQSKASRHLRYLYNAGVVEDRRSAVWIYYHIAETLAPEQRALLESVVSCMEPGRKKSLEAKLAAWKTSQARCAPVQVPHKRARAVNS
ncbi:MAG: winged helix-turn-helix transcriptional regulator [bacterium]|nr:winged helix-turn-helix transcriptional regulator [bacterium]